MLEPSCLTQHTCWCVKSVLSEDQMLIEQRIWDGMPLLAIRSSHSKMPIQNAKNATFVDNTHVVAASDHVSDLHAVHGSHMGRM